MDENSDAEGNYTLLSWQNKSGNEQMMPVGVFEYIDNKGLPVSATSTLRRCESDSTLQFSDTQVEREDQLDFGSSTESRTAMWLQTRALSGRSGQHQLDRAVRRVLHYYDDCVDVRYTVSVLRPFESHSLTTQLLTARYYRYEQKLACLLWKVDVRDVILLRTNSEYTLQNLRNTINVSALSIG